VDTGSSALYPHKYYTVQAKASSVERMKDVYFVELIANPVCDRMIIASIFDKLFFNVRVIYGNNGASTLPTGEKLNKFCSELIMLLLSWPGKVIVVGSPEFCVQYAKKSANVPKIISRTYVAYVQRKEWHCEYLCV